MLTLWPVTWQSGAVPLDVWLDAEGTAPLLGWPEDDDLGAVNEWQLVEVGDDGRVAVIRPLVPVALA